MQQPTSFALVAGRGTYPLLLAESARKRGVRPLVIVACKGETDRSIARYADEIHWVGLSEIGRTLQIVKTSGVKHAIMAGSIAPASIFKACLDPFVRTIFARLTALHAHSIFGAFVEEFAKVGVELLPANLFMEDHMPAAGQLSARAPSDREEHDIALGLQIGKATSGLDIGQTVVIKEGMVLAVEAFEGTDAAIRRAGKLGGPGSVVIKVAKNEHDIRFDLPVIGRRTIESLRKARASALAIEAGRTILLEREAVLKAANRYNIAIVARNATPP
jgi:DUF1009 family protein